MSILFLMFIILLIVNFVTMDSILKYVYKNYNNEWVSTGKPAGYFWRPKNEDVPFLSSMGFTKHRLSWLKKIPIWLKNDKYAVFMIWLYRLTVIGMFISLILLWPYLS